jgi:hypothetical protein
MVQRRKWNTDCIVFEAFIYITGTEIHILLDIFNNKFHKSGKCTLLASMSAKSAQKVG